MADCLDCEIDLTHVHVPFLLEHLSEFAYKWRDIGTALEFKSQHLRNIEASPSLIATAPHSFMQRLVEEWLEGKYPHTAPPTLANLLKALNSRTVGLGTLATQIRDQQTESNMSSKYGTKVLKIASISQKDMTVSCWKSDVTASENAHVHLKVEVDFKAKKCHWSNTGLVPITIKSSKPILCIPEADIDMDGSQYSCRIKRQLINIVLKVSCSQLDLYKRSLASIYLAQPEVPQDSWPPVSNKTYINLALIKKQAINYGGEYAHLTIRGDMDDILHHKKKIEYKNIFDGLRSGSLFLIEGRPGSGKTTFVHKITRDWAASEVQGPMRLLLLVSLRVLNSWEKPVTIEDILHLLSLQVNTTILQERNGKGVCFIFDGLDEFSPLEGENSIVYKIINKTYLPQSIVIVASRPAALVNLRQRADKAVEVIGFPKNQIFKFVENYPFSNISKCDLLKSYLLSHPNVLHMCYLPIHAAMVAFLFEVMGKVPRTETEVYTHFTRFTIIRSLSKHKEQDELEDMDTDKLSGEEKELFDTICKFALEKTISKKQVLDQSEVKLRLKNKGCNDISLGLITVDRTAGLYGFKRIYTFLHLTYQEYLAAHHISTLSDEDQHKLIEQYGDKDHMQVVWKFYYGLVNFEGHEYKIKALVNARNEISLFDIQCAYESQQEIICNFFMKEMNAQIVLEDKYLTTTDFTALGYLLANSSMPVSLSLIKCDLAAKSADTLLAEIEGKLLSLCTLCCESNKTDLAALMSLLRKSFKPVSLRLIKCDLVHAESAVLSAEIGGEPLSLCALHCESNKTDLGALVLLLRKSSKPVSLRLIKCDLVHDESAALSAEIGGGPLSFDNALYCESSKIDFFALVYLLRNNSKPVSLSLIECDIPESSMLVGMGSLSLRALNYSHGNLDSLGIVKNLLKLQQGIECLEIFVNTYFSRNTVDDFGFSDIVSTSLANLKELRLTGVQVGPKTLSNVLQFCEELTSLVLNHRIDDYLGPLLPEVSKCKMLRNMSCSVPPLLISGVYIITIATHFDIVPKLSNISNIMFKLCVQGDRGNHFQTLRLEIPNRAVCDLKPFSTCWPPRPRLFAFNQNPCNVHDVISTLAECVLDFSALEKLMLKNVDIDSDVSQSLLAEILSHCVTLQELDLSHDLTQRPKDITTVLTGLKNCSNLQKLAFENIYINPKDWSTCLQHWPKLQELHLKGCGIKEKGAKVIADNINYYPELIEVDLTENNIISNRISQRLKSRQLREKVTKSSSPSHSKVTESSSPLYNEVTKSSSPSHNVGCSCILF